MKYPGLAHHARRVLSFSLFTPESGVDSAEADKVGSRSLRFCAYVSEFCYAGMRHYRTTHRVRFLNLPVVLVIAGCGSLHRSNRDRLAETRYSRTYGSSARSGEPATDEYVAAPSAQPNDAPTSSAVTTHGWSVPASNNLVSPPNNSSLDFSDDSITFTTHPHCAHRNSSIRLLPCQSQYMYQLINMPWIHDRLPGERRHDGHPHMPTICRDHYRYSNTLSTFNRDPAR